MNDTPSVDRTARTIAENVYAAYMRQAEGPIHPQLEQTLVTRLVEVIRTEVPGGTARDIVGAANTVLDAWELQDGEIHGPRVSAFNSVDGSVSMVATKR